MPRARLFYHFVWTTKDRAPVLTGEVRQTVYAAILAKVKTLNGVVHALNGMPDHVHLVVTVPPSLALSAFIGQVKGVSSHLAANVPSPPLDRPFGWQAEYGVITVSEHHLPQLVRYVVNQQLHHTARTLNATLEDAGD